MVHAHWGEDSQGPRNFIWCFDTFYLDYEILMSVVPLPHLKIIFLFTKYYSLFKRICYTQTPNERCLVSFAATNEANVSSTIPLGEKYAKGYQKKYGIFLPKAKNKQVFLSFNLNPLFPHARDCGKTKCDGILLARKSQKIFQKNAFWMRKNRMRNLGRLNMLEYLKMILFPTTAAIVHVLLTFQ